MQNVYPGALTAVDTVAKVPVGSLAEGPNGEEYIYLAGVVGTVRGSAVVYSSTYATTLTVAASRGPVAFALAAIVALSFGWYQRKGNLTPARSSAAVALNGLIYSTATPGAVDDTVVAGSQITGAFATSAPGAAADMTVSCAHPFMNGLG
jgi:hypothetical protein